MANMPLFVYDLDKYPTTCDFIFALVNVSLLCEEHEIHSFDVAICFGSYKYSSPRNVDQQHLSNDWRSVQMLALIPWCFPQCRSVRLLNKRQTSLHEIEACDFIRLQQRSSVIRQKHRSSSLHRTKITLDYFFRGYEIRKAACPNFAAFNVPESAFVTISLRTSRFQPLRNSNLDVIEEICLTLSGMGVKVCIIPDYQDYIGRQLCNRISHYIHHEAACNPLVRMSLYSNSLFNLGTSNGLYVLATLINTPYLMNLAPAPYHATSASFLGSNYGIRTGDSFLWAKSDQRLFWESESASAYMQYAQSILSART